MNENIKIIIKKINYDSINKMDIIDYNKNSNLYVYKKPNNINLFDIFSRYLRYISFIILLLILIYFIFVKYT